MKQLHATVMQGHQVASGRSKDDKRFPDGTIQMQKPHFKERGLDLDVYFDGDYVVGTINLLIDPLTFEIKTPEYHFLAVDWTDLLPPENFFLSKAEILYKGKTYRALIYVPDPATKVDHFKSKSTIEVIAQTIPGLCYGDAVMLIYSSEAIIIS